MEKTITNPLALASELKKAVKGISAGSVGSYEAMWTKLCLHFYNVSMSVFSAVDERGHVKVGSQFDTTCPLTPAGIMEQARLSSKASQMLTLFRYV